MDLSDVALGYGLRAAEKETTPDKLIKGDIKSAYKAQRDFRDRYPVASLAANFIPYVGAALSIDDIQNTYRNTGSVGARDVIDAGVSAASTKLGLRGMGEIASDLVTRGNKGRRAAGNMYGLGTAGAGVYGGSYVSDQMEANRRAAEEEAANNEAQAFMDRSAAAMSSTTQIETSPSQRRRTPKIPPNTANEREIGRMFLPGQDRNQRNEEPFALTMARTAADRAGLPSNLAMGVVFAETSGGKNLTNPRSSARGPYQILKGTFEEVNEKVFGGELDWDNLEHTAIAGATYLKEQYDRFGEYDLAMAAHYIGPNKVRTLMQSGGIEAVMRYKPKNQPPVREYIRRATSEMG